MSVHLSHLTLSHFRSHQRTRLEFDGRPVALHGPNGSGKTNILEAVSLFSPGRGLRRATPDEMARQPQALGWKLRAEIVTRDGPRLAETWAEPGQSRQVRIDEKTAPQIALGALVPMLWLTPAMDRLWLEGAEGRRRFLDRTTLSFAPDHAAQVLAYDKAMRERNRLLRDGVRDTRWFAALEGQMAEAGRQITVNRRAALAELSAHADPNSPFPMADLSLDCSAPDDLAAALAENRARDMAAGRSLIGPHRADLRAVWAAKGVQAAQCSTGEQKAFLISAILANGRALAAKTAMPPLLLLDEVAAHLDAARRAALYDAVCAMGGQCFMTGTGPELFAELGSRAQVFALSDRDGVSHVEKDIL
ncbi:MAG: DNA replication and repair protein RecF [Roseibaca calidilacus]|uniref:DNA replication and repair protein RecF n=1 Tax=Roseibaca calidilacus TaxID=1666912 RepID=A0A0P7YQY9_9RHOB|nr:DNA replication/repair protein RecF [Roseibaca calidilacus]KPP92707.1 MAG: DNA replication and repair protein RecF [Roseibaca calidilacus]CUX80220.1 DNA replication and repair protein RecF [Roseibaca calidilacus]